MLKTATKTGLVTAAVRPKSLIQTKNSPEEAAKKAQRLLLTWLCEEPDMYKNIEKYITESDFTDTFYEKVASKLFEYIKIGNKNPADIISLFLEEEEQREVASIFNTKLAHLETEAEKEKAFHDIVVTVKRNSYEYYSNHLGSDVLALNQVINGKKALEELSKTHIYRN